MQHKSGFNRAFGLALAAVALTAALMATSYAAAPAPASTAPSGGNDTGCPNTSTKQGVYAPCVGYLPAGATSATQVSGVHHLSVEPGVLQHPITVQQAAALGLMPGNLGTPSFGAIGAVSLTGGAGQQNPSSPPQTAQQYCGTGSSPAPGTDGWSYSANPVWSGWDNLSNPPQTYEGWQYSCTFTQQPSTTCTYISGYDAYGNPIQSTYAAYGAWSWGNGNNGSWSQPDCSRPNAMTPPPRTSCPAGQTQTSPATWNGSAWVGLACQAPQQPQTCATNPSLPGCTPPPNQPTCATNPNLPGCGGGNPQQPTPAQITVCSSTVLYDGMYYGSGTATVQTSCYPVLLDSSSQLDGPDQAAADQLFLTGNASTDIYLLNELIQYGYLVYGPYGTGPTPFIVHYFGCGDPISVYYISGNSYEQNLLNDLNNVVNDCNNQSGPYYFMPSDGGGG